MKYVNQIRDYTVSETQGVKAGVALLTAMPNHPLGDVGLLVFAILDSIKL